MRIITYILLSSCLLAACKDDAKVSRHTAEEFFDLEAFVREETNRFQQSNCRIYKEASVNGETDQGSQTTTDWDKELRILANMSIRKSAWYDYFSIDTVRDDGNDLVTVRYTTESSKIPVKLLELSYAPNDFKQPLHIHVERQNQNLIFRSSQSLYYTAGAALKAEGSQKMLWFDEQNFSITTLYNCTNEPD